MTPLAAWVLALMVSLQNPNGWGISPSWAYSYVETAVEIAEASESAPLLRSPRHTAALLVVMAYRESRFNRDARGDGGSAIGLFQVHKEWVDYSAAGALHLVHESFRMCAAHPLAERLGWYAAGGAGCERRLELSRSRMREAARLAGAK